MCGETVVIGCFPLQRESNADLWCLTLTNEGRSGDMPLYEPAMAYFSEVVSYWIPVEIWANQQQDNIGWYYGLVQIRRQANIWINDGNFTCNTHSCRTFAGQFHDNATGHDMTSHMFSQLPHSILLDIYEIHRNWWQYQHGFVCNIPDGYAGTFFKAMDSNELLCQFGLYRQACS